jgi:hypothetical protein
MKTNKERIRAPVPEESRKLFWIRKETTHKLYEPVIRALHSRGYSQTMDYERAHLLWSDHPFPFMWNHQKPWQRYNWIPSISAWDDKDAMAYNMNMYYAKKGVEPLFSFPESYLLHTEDDFRRFQYRLKSGGINDPWVLKEPTVNQGKGVEIVGPHSKPLQDILNREKVNRKTRRVAQKYICDELTYSGRKFDFRIFWMVASVDPFIVLYQTKHNYVRIGHAAYDETDFSNTKSHLTTHTFGADEGKATWDEFQVYIEEFHALQGERLAHIKDPFHHLESQVKQVISHLADAFKNITYHTRDITAENAFTWHAADMILDNDLDVYIIEGTDGPGKDEDYDFRIEMHNTIFGEMIDITEEVVRRQEAGLPLDVQEMKKDGILDSYDVVYDDGWMFEYTFERLPKRGCNVSEGSSANAKKVVIPYDISKAVQKRANLTALPKRPEGALIKTFYMEGRTGQDGEPIARSLRSKGWIPIDDMNAAQLVFRKEYERRFPKLQPWQYYNQMPQEEDFIAIRNKRSKRGKTCGPLLYNGRPFYVKTYWLVLSLDPLIVYYRDGYLSIPYDKDDENEFLFPLPDKHVRVDPNNAPIWRGSWGAFGHFLTNKTTEEDPLVHVTSQAKLLTVDVAKDMHKFATRNRPAPQTFGVYMTSFELDRRLNLVEPIISRVKIPSEGTQYVVDMHDDVFGSAFTLLETLNRTRSGFRQVLDPTSGGYQLVIDGESNWEFDYSWERRLC